MHAYGVVCSMSMACIGCSMLHVHGMHGEWHTPRQHKISGDVDAQAGRQAGRQAGEQKRLSPDVMHRQASRQVDWTPRCDAKAGKEAGRQAD